ncbi:MAG: hypothetical protein KAY32_15185 [Candidatus Eisenbacteria sp.]|nr:hypothetical protein [Candidatus Eisenbacteria bacterium]
MFRLVALLAIVFVSVQFSQAPPRAQIGDETPKHDERVRKILKEDGVQYTVDTDGDFKVIFQMGDDRTQMAFIRSRTEEYRNLEIREIWSFGYQSSTDVFPAEVASRLLEDTFIKKLGAWAKIGQRALFVVKVSADANSESLMSALQMALESADEMEEELTGDKDEF